MSEATTKRTLNIKGKLINFEEPKVMGIMNVTPDSFFAGSRVQTKDSILARVRQLKTEGADIIDIGGYSTRPGAEDVSAEEEYSRLAVGLEIIRKEWADAIISVDTFRGDVARRCIDDWDVEIINDVGGGTLDEDIWQVVAEKNTAYVLMHMRGTPSTMTSLTRYDNAAADILSDMAKKVAELRKMGVADIIIDPGFGFAKDVYQNYQLLHEVDMFHIENAPVLAGLSRKSMIWKPLEITPGEAVNGTSVLNTIALLNGADILRVHDVKESKEVVKLISLYKENGTIWD